MMAERWDRDLAALAGAAACAAGAIWLSRSVQAAVWESPVASHAAIAGGAFVLSMGVPGARGGEPQGLRGWAFLAAKLALLMALVFFASFDIGPWLSKAPIQPQLTVAMYALGYRWALNDQRRRCPQCLRLLGNAVQIGHPAGTLLEWYGEELVCARGHGVLHEPEMLRSSYCARRWVRFDASWQGLFR